MKKKGNGMITEVLIQWQRMNLENVVCQELHDIIQTSKEHCNK